MIDVGVVIYDAALLKSLRLATGKSSGPIYPKDLTTIQCLDLNNSNITNIEGLQYCVSLEGLYLDNNGVKDIHQLSALTKLRYLHIRNNQIEDISSLSKLTNLEYLLLKGNICSDYLPINNMYSKLTDRDFILMKYSKVTNDSKIRMNLFTSPENAKVSFWICKKNGSEYEAPEVKSFVLEQGVFNDMIPNKT